MKALKKDVKGRKEEEEAGNDADFLKVSILMQYIINFGGTVDCHL